MSIKKKFRVLFKQIIEKIFLIIYPKPYSISHDYKIFKVKIKSDKKKTLFKIFQITNCKIYTDTLYNVTYIKNNMILSNISRQLSPKGFYLHNNCNNVLKKGTPNIKKN